MSSRWTRRAAVALAAAALAPWLVASTPRVADPLAQVEREVSQIEERLASVERFGVQAEEPPAVRAQRRFEEGDRQYGLGDWLNAAILIADAVDEPAWSDARDRAAGLFFLADALRRQGLCGAARVRYGDYLALGDQAHRPDAVSGALDCAVQERRQADIDRLLLEADRTFGAEAPAEVRYLAAKAAFQRKDLAVADRIARATAAFEKVGPPFQLQAWYFQGVLRLQEANLHGSLQWFEGCARAEASGDRDEEVRELCRLALGRVHAQMGNGAAAIGWYAAVPWDSPRFTEAMHETALAHVRAKQYERALEMTSFIPELAPESPLAPEATVLRGHLLLRLGRYAEATEAYNVVINTYAPVRDEIDAILSMQEDPRPLLQRAHRTAGEGVRRRERAPAGGREVGDHEHRGLGRARAREGDRRRPPGREGRARPRRPGRRAPAARRGARRVPRAPAQLRAGAGGRERRRPGGGGVRRRGVGGGGGGAASGAPRRPRAGSRGAPGHRGACRAPARHAEAGGGAAHAHARADRRGRS